MTQMNPFSVLISEWMTVLVVCMISGCSLFSANAPQLESGLQPWNKVGSDPVTLYVPKSVSTSLPAPLIFVLHGSTGEGASALEHSGMIETAEKYGIILAAPNGAVKLRKGFAWNIPGVVTVDGTVPDNTVRDDVKYIADISDSLTGVKIVDQSRIYVMGISGGGRMTSWLACVDSDRFAAVAPVVGLRAGTPLTSDPTKPDTATCNPAQAMPVISFAGNKDTVNPIEGGGSQYWQYSMKEAELRWAVLNDCKSAPASEQITKDILETRYNNCKDGAEVITYVADGAGHDWVADNEKLWDFFTRFQRDANGKLKTRK